MTEPVNLPVLPPELQFPRQQEFLGPNGFLRRLMERTEMRARSRGTPVWPVPDDPFPGTAWAALLPTPEQLAAEEAAEAALELEMSQKAGPAVAAQLRMRALLNVYVVAPRMVDLMLAEPVAPPCWGADDDDEAQP